jgi:myb proto-oncogene protein
LEPNLRNKGKWKGNCKWTPEEDAKLTEAVKKHGDNWVDVAALVPGRTDKQCSKTWRMRLDPIISTGKWTPEEDTKLTEAVNAVKEFGSNYWVRVAVLVPGRTNVQCRTRWVESLDPGINRGSWTEEEDETLTEAVTEHGTNSWVVVAALFPGRTNLQCRQRWVTSLH